MTDRESRLRSPVSPDVTVVSASSADLLAELDYRNTIPVRRVIATAGQRKGQHGTATGPPAGWYELVLWDGEAVTNGYHKADLADESEGGAEDAISRIALLFAAILTADGMLSQAAADVLPGRPGNVTCRQHIENWLRETS